MSSPTATAPTAWSATGRFTIDTAPATPISLTPNRDPWHSGEDGMLELQLSAGVPAGGATVALSSSNPSAVPVPSNIQVQGTHAWTQFQVRAGQVSVATAVTLTATLNGVSVSSQLTISPPSLKALTLTPSTTSGGVPAGAILMLNGASPSRWGHDQPDQRFRRRHPAGHGDHSGGQPVDVTQHRDQ